MTFNSLFLPQILWIAIVKQPLARIQPDYCRLKKYEVCLSVIMKVVPRGSEWEARDSSAAALNQHIQTQTLLPSALRCRAELPVEDGGAGDELHGPGLRGGLG